MMCGVAASYANSLFFSMASIFISILQVVLVPLSRSLSAYLPYFSLDVSCLLAGCEKPRDAACPCAQHALALFGAG